MRIKDFEFTLRDGRKAVIRNPREEDIHGMLDYLYKSSGETHFLLRYPEECTKYTIEGEKALFERANSSGNEAMIICEVDGRIVGSSHMMWSSGIKTRHRASVAIAVLREYWSQGIGTRLMEELISIAERNKDIIQLELEYIEGNERARALYEKLGFRVTGVKPDAIRLKDGTFLNEYQMVKRIHRQ